MGIHRYAIRFAGYSVGYQEGTDGGTLEVAEDGMAKHGCDYASSVSASGHTAPGKQTPMSGDLELVRAPDAKEAARLAAERIAGQARSAVAERGTFSMAVSGGKTPWLMLAMLSSVAEMPWESTQIFQVDERLASPGSPDRNLTHLILTLPIEKQAALKPMPVTRRDLEEAVTEYNQELPERLDLVHLGLGMDGQTASLLPGDPVVDVADRKVALTTKTSRGHRCMTLTLPAINNARSILWLVTGDAKKDALAALLAGDREAPAGRVRREAAVVVADLTATGEGSTPAPADLWRQQPG